LSAQPGQHGIDGRLCVVGGDESPLRAALAEGLEDAGAVVATVAGARDRDAAGREVQQVRDRLGPIEMLVCCPPVTAAASLEELPPAAFDAALDAGFKSPLRLTQAVLPDMYAGGFGRIVYVTSGAGVRGRAFTSHVAASARALASLAQTITLEDAPVVTANAIAVGPIEGSTLLEARLRSLGPDALPAAIAERAPFGGLPQATDVLEAVIWALRPSSGFLSGQTIAVAAGSELQVWP
jgi:NAD(P)-dependent dehydrogenase (short-subunit alcohol dehydrogenase family)